MAKSLKLRTFPEEITEDGIKIYGETSYENQMAVLSHDLHNNHENVSDGKKEEIIFAIRDFLSRKQSRQSKTYENLTDEQIWNLHFNMADFHYLEPQTLGDNRPKFRDVMERKVSSVKYHFSTVYVETFKRQKITKRTA